jgi:predicted nucleic acid-binding protein
MIFLDTNIISYYFNANNKVKEKLMDFFKIYGPWEDNRDVETIISDIQNSKVSKDNMTY